MGDYSSGDEATLPSDTTNLEHVYDATDLSNVQTEDSNYVEQTATGEYPIHQYKDTITSSLANITWIGKSDQAPSTYPVYLQIYKTAVPAAWETIATKNTGDAGVDFTLQKLAQDTSTDYKDGSNVVCVRVYQDYTGGEITKNIGENSNCDYSGCTDTWLHGGNPDTNYGTNAIMQVYANGTQNSIIKFPGLSNISASATVTNAKLYLYSHDSDGSMTAHVRRVLRNWDVATATWNVYSTGNSWTTGGGTSLGNDISNTLTVDVSTDGTTKWYEITSAQLIVDVQDMISTAANNFGWLLYETGGSGEYVRFSTSDDSTATLRPYLVVTYTS